QGQVAQIALQLFTRMGLSSEGWAVIASVVAAHDAALVGFDRARGCEITPKQAVIRCFEAGIRHCRTAEGRKNVREAVNRFAYMVHKRLPLPKQDGAPIALLPPPGGTTQWTASPLVAFLEGIARQPGVAGDGARIALELTTEML